ncbi:MAG TPA: flagellar basal-body rod protein FlgG [Chthonomonadaceae bacterium]|nr:flagellar basal-body rod protein FlgG [Chthonomonadaceae bacterium]
MLRSLFTSASGLAAQQFNLDVISNNLANVSTTGFKKSRANFEDLIYQTQREPGTQTGANSNLPTGSQVGLGVSAGTTSTMHTQGTLVNTGSASDLALSGDGFFKIQLPDGTFAYTRSGNFQVDGTGKLVTTQGYPVQPDIAIPTNRQSVSIGADGTVSVLLPGQTAEQKVGQITVTNFVNPAGLKALGGNLFQVTAASGQPNEGAPGTQGLGSISSGMLEASNVDTVEEIVKMIIVQRAYDSNSKVIQAADEMLSTTNGIKR